MSGTFADGTPAAGGDSGDETPSPEYDPSKVKPGMNLNEIRDAGLMVDVPYETASADPPRLRYEDGIADTPFEIPSGWPENLTDAGESVGDISEDESKGLETPEQEARPLPPAGAQNDGE